MPKGCPEQQFRRFNIFFKYRELIGKTTAVCYLLNTTVVMNLFQKLSTTALDFFKYTKNFTT